MRFHIIQSIKAKEAYLQMFFRFGKAGNTYILEDTFNRDGKLFFVYANAKEFMPKTRTKEVDPESEILEMTAI